MLLLRKALILACSLLLLMIEEAFSGFVLPDKANPIIAYRNNDGAWSSYTFYLKMQTRIPANSQGEIRLTFPQDYGVGSGAGLYRLKDDTLALNDECPVYLQISVQTICPKFYNPNFPLPPPALTLSIPMDTVELPAGSVQIIVKYVKNPTGVANQGTGGFKIETFNTKILQDATPNLGQIAFSPPYVLHNSASSNRVDNDGSSLGGFLTNYVLTFTTTVALKAGDWFRFRFPPGFTFSSPICELSGGDTVNTMNCAQTGIVLFFDGIPKAMAIGVYKMKVRNVYNRYLTGKTEFFYFETLQQGTNTVYEYYEVDGVVIKPGLVGSPTIQGNPLNKNLRIDYTITFKPTNQVPVPGKMTITFPRDAYGNGFKLDPSCRIIQGLTPVGSTDISCVTSGDDIIITNFNSFIPQLVELKIFAQNPPIAKIYTPLVISTFSKFGDANGVFAMIDTNEDAGQIAISEIDRPVYVQIDLYRKMYNSTLNDLKPLDFRWYPQQTSDDNRILQYTPVGAAAAQKYQISLQIPLLWRNNNQGWRVQQMTGLVPGCTFGAEPSANQCDYYLHVYSIDTPKITNYLKEPTQVGLGECDLPISIDWVKLPPFGGWYPFRGLTFKQGYHKQYSTVPTEQDIYLMFIEIPPFTTYYIAATSRDPNDIDNLIYAQLNVGIAIPYEGAINLNFTVKDDIDGNTAAWPDDLGFTFPVGEIAKAIPCTVYIGGQLQGQKVSTHPDVRCFVFKGDAVTQKNAIIQVRGFAQPIGTGTSFEIFVPHVKTCSHFNMYCRIEMNSAYTTEVFQPYVLNKITYTVSLVSATINSVAKTYAQDPKLSATFGTEKEICLLTTWTITLTLDANLIPGDGIILRFPRDRFTFLMTATCSIGRAIVIDHYPTNQIYYYINVTTTITMNAAGSSFTLSGIRNANDPTPGVILNMIYWALQRRVAYLTYNISTNFQDGGFSSAVFDIFPQTPIHLVTRSMTNDMDLDAEIIYRIGFTNCHEIDTPGMLQIKVPTGYASVSGTCSIFQGVVGIPRKLSSQIQCLKVGSFFQITGFLKIPQFTAIIVLFRAKSPSIATAIANYEVRSYFDKNGDVSDIVPASNANINDYNYNPITPPSINGPNRFPNKLQWGSFYKERKFARNGARGVFNFTVKTNFYRASTAADPQSKLVFTIPNTFNPSFMHCRINDVICPVCTDSGSTYTLDLPFGLNAGQTYLVTISTRGNDISSTTREGLEITDAGLFQVSALAVQANAAENENRKLTFRHLPASFQNFWIWSVNKVSHNTAIDPELGLTIIKVFFQLSGGPIPKSSNSVKIIVEFHRTILPLFDSGFMQDLGTGWPHRTIMPCVGVNIPPLAPATKITCRLYYGTWPNPTQMIVTDFDQLNAGTLYELHIPKIFTPNATHELVKITLRAEQADVNGKVTPLYENDYDLVNMTHPMPVMFVPTINRANIATTAPTFGAVTHNIDTAKPLTIKIKSNLNNLQPSDYIIIQLPMGWILPTACVCSFTGVSTKCDIMGDARQVLIAITGAMTAGTLYTGTINLKTPPYKLIVAASETPIKAYVYWRSHLQDVWTYPVFADELTLVLQVNSMSEGGLYNIDEVCIPVGGVLRIYYPADLIPKDSGCRNDLIGGSKLPNAGFTCTIDTGTKSMLISGFPGFTIPSGYLEVKVLIRMLNPSNTGTPGNWIMEQWFEEESPLNKLVAKGTLASPAINYPPTPPKIWQQQFQQRFLVNATTKGPLEIRMSLPTGLPVGQSITISHAAAGVTGFTQPSDTQIMCYWDFSAYYDDKHPCLCSDSGSLWTINAPNDAAVPTNKLVTIVISTVNNLNGVEGYIFPNTFGWQSFTITQGTNTATRKVYIPHTTQFYLFESLTFIANPLEKNYMQIVIQPQVSVLSTDYFILYIPVTDQQGNQLFAEDLGTGLQNGGSIPCYFRFPAANKGPLTCIITLGSKNTQTHVQVKISGGWASGLNTNTIYTMDMDSFYTPKATNDQLHVETILEHYNSGGVLQENGICYDFSLKTFAYSTTTIASKPTHSTNFAEDTVVTYTMLIYAPTGITMDNTSPYDYFVIEFPRPDYATQPMTLTCGPGTCFLSAGNNWVFYKHTGPISCCTGVNITMQVTNPKYASVSGITLKQYAIHNRILYAKRPYTAMLDFNTASVGGAGFTVTVPDYDSDKIPRSALTRYVLQVQFPVTMYEGGLIDIVMPTLAGSTQTFCSDLTTTPANYVANYISCSNSVAQNYTITGLTQVDANQVRSFEVWSTSLASGTPNFGIHAYQDTGRIVTLFQTTATGPAISAYDQFQTLFFLPYKGPQAVTVGKVSDFSFTMTTAATIQLVRVIFPAAASVSLPASANLICTINGQESATCFVQSTSPLTIYVYSSLTTPTVASGTVKVMISSTCGTSGGADNSGLLFGAAGMFIATIQISGDGTNTIGTNALTFEVLPTPQFASAIFRTTHQTAGGTNMELVFEVTTSVTIPAGGAVRVRLQNKAEGDQSKVFFSDMFGAVFPLGSGSVYTSCFDVGGNLGGDTCYMFQHRETEVAFLNIPNSIAAGSSISFVITNIPCASVAAGVAHFPVQLLSETSIGTVLESRIFWDWITPVTETLGTVAANSLQVTPTPLSSTNANYKFTNIGNSKPLTPNSRLIFEFPNSFKLNPSTITTVSPTPAGSIQVFGNLIMFIPTTTLSAGTQTYNFNGINSPDVIDTSLNIINIYRVYDNHYKDKTTITITVGATGTTLTTPTVSAFTYFSIDQSCVQNNIQKVMIVDFTSPSDITQNTLFMLQFPASVGATQPTEIPCGTTTPSMGYDPLLYCNYDSTNRRILFSGFTARAAGTPVQIIFTMFRPCSGSTSCLITLIQYAQRGTVIQNYLSSPFTLSLVSATPTINSINIAPISTVGPQTLGTFNLQFTEAQNITTGDKIIIYQMFTQQGSWTSAAPSITINSPSLNIGCTFYEPNTAYIVCVANEEIGVGVAFDISLGNWPNTGHALPINTVLFEVITVANATNSTYSQYQFKLSSASGVASMSSASVTQLAVNRYQFDLTLASAIGVKGYIVVNLASFAMSLTSRSSAILDYQVITSSGITGTLRFQQQCLASTNSATALRILGPTAWAAGTTISIIATVIGASSSLATTSVTFTSYSYYGYQIDTYSTTLTISTLYSSLTSAKLFSIGQVIRNTNEGDVALAGQQGMFSFRFQTTAQIAAGEMFNVYDTNNILGLTSLPSTTRFKCNVKTVANPFSNNVAARSCQINAGKKSFEMIFSAAMTFQSDLYELNIFMLDLDSPLFTYPASNQQVRFMLNHEVVSTYLIKQTGVTNADLFTSKLNQGCVRSFINNNADFNLLRIKFIAPSGIAASDVIDVEFPQIIKTSTSVTYYDKDVGTGIQNGWFVGVTDKQGNLGSSFTARVFYAPQQRMDLVSRIRITGVNAVAAGQTVWFNIMKIKNPALTGLFTTINVRIGDLASKITKSFLTFRYVTYTVTKTVTPPASVAPPSWSATTTLTLVNTLASHFTFTPTTKNLQTNEFACFYFTFPSDYCNPTLTSMTATIDGSAANVEVMSNTQMIIEVPATKTAGVSITIALSNFKTPALLGSYTAAYSLYSVVQRVKYQAKPFSGSVTLTQGATPLIGTLTTTASSYMSAEPLVIYTFSIPFNSQLDSPGTLELTFPAGFTVAASQTCRLFTTVPLATTSCSNTGSVFTAILASTSIAAASQTVQLIVDSVTNPASGATSTFTFKVYKDSAKTLLLFQGTAPAVTINAQTTLVAYMFQPKTRRRIMQYLDTGPIRLEVDITATVTARTGYFRFKPLQAPKNFLTAQADAKEFACFFNDMAAFECEYLSASDQITVYAPSATALAAGTYTLYIYSIRSGFRKGNAAAISGGLVQNNFKNTLTPASYIATPTMIKNIAVTISAGSTCIKDWRFYNLPFNWQSPPYIVMMHTSTGEFTMLKVHFRTQINILQGADMTQDWGRFVLELPTMDEFGNTIYPDDLGRFTKNGQEIDCLCTSCTNENLFRCYVNIGANDITAPVQILIDPQIALNFVYDIDLFLPKVRVPLAANIFSKARLYSLKYIQSPSKLTIEMEMLLTEYFFYTYSASFSTVTNGGYTPNFSPHTVGAPSTVTFPVSNPSAFAIDPNTKDRFIIQTNTAEMIVEQPYNPASPNLKTTATNANVYVYPLAKWIEFVPTTTFGASQTHNLNFQNFKNMPYMIPSGMDFQGYAYVDCQQRSYNTYAHVSTAAAHALHTKQATTMTDDYIYQPDQMKFIFYPYNKIPANGVIVVTYGSGDWTWSNTYCKTPGGVDDPSCDVVTSNKKFEIKNMASQYLPIQNGTITVLVEANNPTYSVTTQFTVTTYWDLNGYLTGTKIIDQDNTFGSVFIKGGNIMVVTMLERYEHLYPICGGMRGPLSLTFNFRNNLDYPNDYVRLSLYGAFTAPACRQELLCYFNNPSVPKEILIKTFRCDYITVGGTQAIDIYVPEELQTLHAGQDYEVVIDTRGCDTGLGDGLQAATPSNVYWIVVSNSKPLEVGWMEVPLPPCPFDQSNFFVESISWEASPPGNAEQITWNIINMTLMTINNDINNGDLSNNNRCRFLFEFFTHSEIENGYDVDISGYGRTISDETTKQISCNGLYRGGTKPLQPQGSPYIECWAVTADAVSFTTPSIVYMQYFQNIPLQTPFNLQLAKVKNSEYVNAHTHYRIRVQQRLADGNFYDINLHWIWHIVPGLLAVPTPATSGPTISWGPSNAMVAESMNNISYHITNKPWNVGIGDVFVFNYSLPYELPTRSICKQHRYPRTHPDWCDTACTLQPFAKWVVIASAMNLNTTENFYTYELGNSARVNPDYIYKEGGAQSPYRTFIYISHMLKFNVSQGMQTPVKGSCYIVMEPYTPNNPHNEYVTYKIGMYLYTLTPLMKRIDFYIPNDFQDIQNCVVLKGLVLVDPNNISNPITCSINPPGSPIANKWYIYIQNFGTYKGDGFIIIQLLIKNPLTPRWTPNWRCVTYCSETDLLLRTDENTAAVGRTWVGSNVPFPNLFRVYRNTQSFESRRAQTNDYAEVQMRLIPKNPHPQTDDIENTRVEIWMPLQYDIANGGQVLCEIQHDYHEDAAGQLCEMTSDRKLFVNTNRQTGLDGQCGMVRVTTQGAIGTAPNGDPAEGVKMPAEPGDNSFQVFITSRDSAGNVLREYQTSGAAAKPQLLNDLIITSSERETGRNTRVIVTFTANMDISPGYDTSNGETDPLNKPAVGYLFFDFNTLDYINGGNRNGFPLDLGMGAGVNTVPCKPYKGLTPFKGQKLKCELIRSPQTSIYYPTRILVSNFDPILKGTFIEIHFIEIGNIQQSSNNGLVQVGSFEIKGDGSITQLILPTPGYISCGSAGTIITYSVLPNPNPNITTQIYGQVNISPNTVGSYAQFSFEFSLNPTLAVGDNIVLTFPAQFEFVDEGKTTAVTTVNGLATQLYMYEMKNQLYIQMLSSFPGSTTVTTWLTVSQMRNAGWQFSGTYTINMKVIRSNRWQHNYNFVNLPPPTPSDFVSTQLLFDKQSAQDVFVTYTISFTPSYHLPPGSKITVDFPSNVPSGLDYSFLGQSSPPEVCSVSDSNLLDVATCTISANQITVQTSSVNDTAEQTPLTITIKGAKNPNFVGSTASVGNYQITAAKSTGEKINFNTFPPITFLPPQPPAVLYMKIISTSYFKLVSSDYTFSLQASNTLPQLGLIYIKFPSEWGTQIPITSGSKDLPFSITGDWTLQSLSYSCTYSFQTAVPGTVPLVDYDVLKIDINFEWPAKSTLYIKYNGIINPNVDQTNIFQVYTEYDSKILDKTDFTDSSLSIKYSDKPPDITSSFSFGPQNAGEISTYNFTLTPSTDIPPNSTFELQFPVTQGFTSTLSSYDKTIGCKVNGEPVICTVVNGKLSVPYTQGCSASTPVKLEITGIQNPSEGSYNIGLTTRNGNNILQFADTPPSVSTTQAAPDIPFTFISTTSTNLQTKSNYSFCIQAYDPIPVTAAVFVDFPQQFPFLSQYSCSTLDGKHTPAPNGLIYAQGTKCKTETNSRRMVITGQTAAFAGGQTISLCYLVWPVENPADSGSTDNFVVSVYDQATQQVLAKTHGTLSFPTTLTYKREGLQIVVDSIPNVPQGTMSNEIAVQLELAVSYKITLTPEAEGFEFDPTPVVFDPSKGAIQTFKIKPLSNAKIGLNKISWTKVEDGGNNKFSEIADSYFTLVATPKFKELKCTVGQTVSRTSLGGTSLPIKVTLSQPANSNLTLYYTTERPSQNDTVFFTPDALTFMPGEVVKTFTYTTKTSKTSSSGKEAVSGSIKFRLDSNYSGKYYMPVTELNFEVLDLDRTPPKIINYYIVDMDRTYMYFRVSSSESVWVYYMLSYLGTEIPPMKEELKDPNLRKTLKHNTDVMEVFGKNSSYQAPVTQTFIYYDTFLLFTGLEEQTNYVLYFLIEDLSGNLGDMIGFNFTTLQKHLPAKFKIRVRENVSADKLKNAFALVTSFPPDRFVNLSMPLKFDIPEADEKVVRDIIDKSTVTYEFMLLQNATSNEVRPIETISLLEKYKSILQKEIPSLDTTYDLNKHAYSYFIKLQEFKYLPKLFNVTEDSATFRVSIKYTGELYGIVLLNGTREPNTRQLKHGLNSSNFKLPTTQYSRSVFRFDPKILEEKQNISDVITFTGLFDNTDYIAYFIAQNNLPVNPDLMTSDQIYKIAFKTYRESVIVPEGYVVAGNSLVYHLLFLLIPIIVALLA